MVQEPLEIYNLVNLSEQIRALKERVEKLENDIFLLKCDSGSFSEVK